MNHPNLRCLETNINFISNYEYRYFVLGIAASVVIVISELSIIYKCIYIASIFALLQFAIITYIGTLNFVKLRFHNNSWHLVDTDNNMHKISIKYIFTSYDLVILYCKTEQQLLRLIFTTSDKHLKMLLKFGINNNYAD